MPLYRIVYVRDGKPRGMTIAHESALTAARWAERYIDSLKRYFPDVELLTVMTTSKRDKRRPEDIARQSPLY